MEKITASKFYQLTKTAEIIAHNGKYRRDRIQTLFLTKKGRLFLSLETWWQGEHDTFFEVQKSELPDLEFSYFKGGWNRKEKFEQLVGEL